MRAFDADPAYSLFLMDDQTVLVTGAAGFIGSHAAAALLRRGARVVGLDNFDPFYPRELKLANLRAIEAGGGGAGAGRFELVTGDFTDAAATRALFDRVKPTGVIHLGAKAGVRPSLADPLGYLHTNVMGTQSVLDAAAAAGCGRVIIASSSSVYGNTPNTPFREDDRSIVPISPYAASKLACELIAQTHHHLTGRPVACLRFFTVFGPRQRPDLAIALFLDKIASGQPITMFGDGSMSRDFTFVDDIVAGVLAAYDRIDRHGFRVWNLGHSEPVRLDAMIATIAEVVGRAPVIERKPMQPGDVDRTFADLTRSRAELDYQPATEFVEGVRRQWLERTAVA